MFIILYLFNIQLIFFSFTYYIYFFFCLFQHYSINSISLLILIWWFLFLWGFLVGWGFLWISFDHRLNISKILHSIHWTLFHIKFDLCLDYVFTHDCIGEFERFLKIINISPNIIISYHTNYRFTPNTTQWVLFEFSI
jgi:hypothetical protein